MRDSVSVSKRVSPVEGDAGRVDDVQVFTVVIVYYIVKEIPEQYAFFPEWSKGADLSSAA